MRTNFLTGLFDVDDISEVTKSHPKGNDDIVFLKDLFHKCIVAIKMKLPNSMPFQGNVRTIAIE